MLTYTRIEAQTSGIVADRYADPGDLAVPGKSLLTLHDPEKLELQASVREGLTGKVHLGMQLPVQIDALSRSMTGTIREIVPKADRASRSVLVKVALPQDQLEGVYLGMFGRLSIPVQTLEHTVVAAAAVERIGQLEVVEVVAPDGALQRRFVRTGQRIGDQIEILSGLSVDELVVLKPLGNPAG